MHTLVKSKDDKWDVVFATTTLGYSMSPPVVIPALDFEAAVWYVNVLNGGAGELKQK